ncbi:MAG: cupin domain-containing protein [Melioribacter sp.]|nr:cupin domain-containing protein [Melioribacter sp.]
MNMIKKLVLIIISFYVIIYSQEENAQTVTDKTKKFNIENCVNEFSHDKVEKTKVGYQYWFVDKEFLDGRTIKLSVVAPHSATHAPHRHKEDEFFFVIEGTAEFFLDGETKIVNAYSSFYCPPNSLHGIRNVGDKELKYLVIKKYDK